MREVFDGQLNRRNVLAAGAAGVAAAAAAVEPARAENSGEEAAKGRSPVRQR